MIILLSPAKNLDLTSALPSIESSLPEFLPKSQTLVRILKKHSPSQLMELMGISAKLAQLNYERYQRWNRNFSTENARPAILTFNGEVYNGLKARDLDKDSLYYAQDHLRILSGLHGILRPLDLIQAYRLEMGTPLCVGQAKDLYAFWGNTISRKIREAAAKTQNKVLINLASHEYAKAARLEQFKGRVITPVFKQLKGENLSTITLFMKKARGLMTRFILENRIEDPEQLKLFDAEGYFYSDTLSKEGEWLFVR